MKREGLQTSERTQRILNLLCVVEKRIFSRLNQIVTEYVEILSRQSDDAITHIYLS